jgi:hypothetical protein
MKKYYVGQPLIQYKTLYQSHLTGLSVFRSIDASRWRIKYQNGHIHATFLQVYDVFSAIIQFIYIIVYISYSTHHFWSGCRYIPEMGDNNFSLISTSLHGTSGWVSQNESFFTTLVSLKYLQQISSPVCSTSTKVPMPASYPLAAVSAELRTH